MQQEKQAEIKRNPDGTLMKGYTANPNGRPKGKSLKEFAREYLMSLPEEEKLEYLSKLPKDIVWKMAEGNPDNKSEVNNTGNPIIVLANEIANKNDSDTSPSNNS